MKSIKCELSSVLLIGGTRYSYPLGEKHKKKFHHLSKVSRNHIFAFSVDNKFRTFVDSATFYLIPSRMPRFVRYPFFLLTASIMAVYIAFKKDAKVFICQSPYEGIAGITAKYLLRMLHKPISLVTELHGDWEAAPSLYLNPRFRFVSRIYGFLGRSISGFVLKHSDIVRTISDFTTRKFLQKQRKPTITFPTYTNIELFLKTESSNWAFPNHLYNKYILYAGMLIYLKGGHVLIKSMETIVRQYRNLKLLIAGEGEYRKELEKLVRQLKLEDNIVFLGHVEQKILGEYMRGCLVLAHPSFSEGFGNVIVEAMACGRPVIGTNVGAIPELVRDGENGFLVPPDNHEALAEKILYLVQNPDVADEMGAKGKKFVSEMLSTENYVRNFQRMVQMAMENL